MMRSRRYGVTLSLVLGVMMYGCATCVSGTTCGEINIEYCRMLPYTQTGTPNMFGYASEEEQPVNLVSTFTTLVYIGCYDNLQLFLCAAAFPQCTSHGEVLPPCRYLCERAFEGCGIVINAYQDIFVNIDCQAMPNSTDPNLCVGLDTTPQTFTNEQSTVNASSFESTARTKVTNTESNTSSESAFATTSPRQPETTSLEDSDKKASNNTLVNFISSEFTDVSEVIVERATESKGDEKWTNSVDKSVKTGDSDGSQSPLPTLGIILSTVSAVGMVVLLISCAFFKSSFGKPFGSRRKPRDAAFYTNPAFDDLPQGGLRSANGQSSGFRHQPYTLDDLPPHPASIESEFQVRPTHHTNPYQQEPGGYTHQNLFTAVDLAANVTAERDNKNHFDPRRQITEARWMEEDCSGSGDLVYSNKVTATVTTDANANEHGAADEAVANQTCRAPSIGTTPQTNIDEVDDTIISNPIAC